MVTGLEFPPIVLRNTSRRGSELWNAGARSAHFRTRRIDSIRLHCYLAAGRPPEADHAQRRHAERPLDEVINRRAHGDGRASVRPVDAFAPYPFQRGASLVHIRKSRDRTGGNEADARLATTDCRPRRAGGLLPWK